jgi:hypothetical protein
VWSLIERAQSSDAGHFPDALSVTVPLGRLPAEIRGQDVLVSELRHLHVCEVVSP